MIQNGESMKETEKIRNQYMTKFPDAYGKIYEHQNQPPECFIAQVAFTNLNSFLLTTDGRVFSWGGVTFTLGRQFNVSSKDA